MDIISIIRFLAVLSVLVFVHELGHYVAARLGKIKVEEFGIGFPPRVFSKKKGETIYSLNALPIGGFVKLYGEDSSVEKEKDRAYYHKPLYIRAAVVVCGVLMNFILAILAFSVLYWNTGVPQETGRVKIVGTIDGSPARAAGLQENMIVEEVNGNKVSVVKGFTEIVGGKKGEEVTLKINDNGQIKEVKVTPRSDPPQGQGPLGIVVSSSEVAHPPLWKKPFVSLEYSVKETYFWTKVVVVGVATTIGDAISGKQPEGLAGPVGIYQITNDVAQGGILALISFTAVLSVNLGIINIMPFPALDGGRFFFIIVEAITRRRVSERFERLTHTAGMIILLGLLILITISDVGKLLPSGFGL